MNEILFADRRDKADDNAEFLYRYLLNNDQFAMYRKVFAISKHSPDSLLDIDCEYFSKYYNNLEDDLYLAVLAHLKHTKTIIFNTILGEEIKTENMKKSALKLQYWNFAQNKAVLDRKTCKAKLLTALKRDGII